MSYGYDIKNNGEGNKRKKHPKTIPFTSSEPTGVKEQLGLGYV